MIKAIFLDYTGTMVREDDPYTKQLLKIFITSSSLRDPKEALRVVWGMIKKSEWEDYQETFIKKDEMVERILDICEKEYQLCADRKTVHDIWRDSWIHAPLFDDVKPFVQRCSLPVYVVTNDDLCYVEQSLREKELSVAGIISAELVRACKPHREILEEAVRVLKRDTRHFAKRQLTWFRREPDVIWTQKDEFAFNDERILEFMLSVCRGRGIIK